jgi:hypothetical protein
MIETKAAKKQILSEIALLIVADGFHPKFSEQAFHLVKPFGRWIVHVGFIPHRKADMDITVNVSVRIDAVEELVSEWYNEL